MKWVTQIHVVSLVMRKPAFCIYAKRKTQISCAVTAQLISAFVFTTWMVQSVFYLDSKFQASSHFLWLYSPVCVGNPEDRFSCDVAQYHQCKQIEFDKRDKNYHRNQSPYAPCYLLLEPRCEKTILRGFRPGSTQTRLVNHTRWLEA